MKLIIHIGWQKTGTTALQRHCLMNYQTFESKKIIFPETGQLNFAHHRIPWSLQYEKRHPFALLHSHEDASLVESMLAECRARGATTAIISSEEFRALTEEEIRILGTFLAAEDVTIVAYLRSQVDLLDSAYRMAVRWSEQRMCNPFDEFMEDMLESGELDYYTIISRWSQVFGAERIVLRKYDRSTMIDGDIGTDFINTIGIDVGAAGWRDSVDANTSLGAYATEYLRYTNSLPVSLDVHERLIECLREVEMDLKLERFTYIDHRRLKRIRDAVEESNRLLRRQFGIDISVRSSKPRELVPDVGDVVVGLSAAVIEKLGAPAAANRSGSGGAIDDKGKDRRMGVEITGVTHDPYDDVITGAWLDLPRTGPVDGYVFEASGWVVSTAPVAEVEFVHEGNVVASCELNVARYDVAKAHGSSSQVGFWRPIGTVGLPPDFTIKVRVVFQDGRRRQIAEVRGTQLLTSAFTGAGCAGGTGAAATTGKAGGVGAPAAPPEPVARLAQGGPAAQGGEDESLRGHGARRL